MLTELIKKMKIIRNYKYISENDKNIVLALGNFDGIHLGHLEVLKRTISIAEEKKLQSAVISFEPHPLTILKNTKNIRIVSLQDKIKLIEKTGIDILFLFHFTSEFSHLPANQFLQNILVKQLQINHLVIGHDFIFGKNRSGNSTYLEQRSKDLNYGFTQILPHKCKANNIIYSSTKIREYLKNGNITKANELLGKNYSITSRVIKGQNLGMKLGYNTANIDLKDLFRPKFGVYAVRIFLKNNTQIYNGVANIGIRPTIKNNTQKNEILEVHIFNFSDNIYGKKITIEFIAFIREEKKFNNIDELKNQIAKDCQESKELANSV